MSDEQIFEKASEKHTWLKNLLTDYGKAVILELMEKARAEGYDAGYTECDWDEKDKWARENC